MKKFTKILSLALALALVLSTTAFAATVYQVIDFDSYTTLDDFLLTTAEMDTRSAAGAVAKNAATGLNVFYGSSNPTGDWIPTNNPSGRNSRFVTDASGIKWFEPLNTSLTSATSRNGMWAVIADDEWNYTGSDETYIISFGYKLNPLALEYSTSAANYDLMAVWADDAAGTTVKSDTFARFNRVASSADVELYTHNSHSGADARGAVLYGTMAVDTPYKLAVGYKYDETRTYPFKTVAVNGEITNTSDAAGNATNAYPYLLGFNSNHNVLIGEAYRDFKMYTIKNDEALNAADVAGVVPTSNASVEVKFSLPVGALNKAAVEVNGLTNGTDFTVSDVKDVISSSSVYSTVTLNFTKELDAGATYTITFPATTTNEIGTPIADATATFTTEAAPTYTLNIDGYEGLAAGTTEIAADAMAGKTVYFTATATNTSGRATNGTLAIGIYDAEGNLVKYAFANKAFANNGSNSFSAAFKLEANQTAKAFVTGSESIVVFGE